MWLPSFKTYFFGLDLILWNGDLRVMIDIEYLQTYNINLDS